MGIVTRTSSAYHSPRTPLPLAWYDGAYYQPSAATGVNPFDVTSNNPNTNGPNSGPYPPQWCTGRGGVDGNFTVALQAGFTPPVTLVAWEWNRVAGKWFRLGANTTLYETAYDSTYTQSTFDVCENAIILVQSSAAITQVAYMDGTLDPSAASAGLIGPPSEG